MIQIQGFTFNAFQENTYILSDESGQCVIIDPGCSTASEQKALSAFLSEKNLTPVRLLNTHCHIDHILGNKYVHDTWKLLPELHKNDLVILRSGAKTAQLYGLPYDPSPEPESFLDESSTVRFGNSALQVLFTPGHSPGSLVFYSKEQNFAIGGDVLFRESIGRTDFPHCSHSDLMHSIKNKLFLLPDQLVVYPGHGPETTIGWEKEHNPFL